MAIRDSDGDTLPDEMQVFAEGLTRPNGLAYHEGHLYVAGGAHIYRISKGGDVTTLVDDLPTGTGFPVAGLAIGAGERLYVAVGAPCSNCEFADAERGAILSMNLDGSERRVFATGFRNPADVAWYRGRLWTLDSAPPQEQRNALDELNRLEAGGWYGFPYCLGAETINIDGGARGCGEGIAPAMRFGTGAVPTSLAAYPHDLLPGTKDTLIVVLSGEPSQVDFVGYKVIMIAFDKMTSRWVPRSYSRLPTRAGGRLTSPIAAKRFIGISTFTLASWDSAYIRSSRWRSPSARRAGSTSASPAGGSWPCALATIGPTTTCFIRSGRR